MSLPAAVVGQVTSPRSPRLPLAVVSSNALEDIISSSGVAANQVRGAGSSPGAVSPPAAGSSPLNSRKRDIRGGSKSPVGAAQVRTRGTHSKNKAVDPCLNTSP